MQFVRTSLLVSLTLLVAIAVVVNFARPAPIVLVEDGDDSGYSEEQTETLLAQDPGPKCPCPTEIEKTDCDEGLCSGSLSPEFVLSKNRAPFHHDLFRIEAWRSIGFAPEPDPPRTCV